MKLYWLEAEHRYVHRMADVPKGVESEVHEISTDQQSLMTLLNELHGELELARRAPEREHNALDFGEPGISFPIGNMPQAPAIAAAPPPSGDDEGSTRKATQTEVEEAIQAADPAQLASYAENVCWRIKELTNALTR